MSKGATLRQLAARRKLGFLATFEKKLESLRREAERLQRAARDPSAPGVHRSLGEIERVIRGLVGAGPVYDVNEVTAWSKAAQSRIETLQRKKTPLEEADLTWLATEIQKLEQLRSQAAAAAEQVLNEPAIPRISKSASFRAELPKPPVPPKSKQPGPHPAQGSDLREITDTHSDAPIELEMDDISTSGIEPLTQTRLTVSVVVVAQADAVRKKVAHILTHDAFDVLEVSALETALNVIHEESPDLIVVDTDDPAPGGSALIKILSLNPLTEFIPVLRLATSKVSASINTLIKPIEPDPLVALTRRLTGEDIETESQTTSLRDLNLEDLTAFVSSEIRSGVLEAATGSHVHESFRVLEKGPLIASIWGLVARLRRVAAQGSQGKIRFAPTTHGQIGMMALDEAESVLDPASHGVVDEADLAALSGLKVVVADDDVEIRSLFEKILTQAGMKTRTAVDGAAALAEIEQDPPDVIITDILMPNIDGWELTTRLRWDYTLRHIPLIMISWKEDFLQRVRELNTSANGFMLKDVDREQILTRVASVLKPRFTLEQRLADEGTFSGRIERVGITTLFKSAMALRPDCRITIRENWNYFEANIEEGELASVNLTGTDGSFVSGSPALERLLGVNAGRFSVEAAEEVPKKQFSDGSINAIRRTAKRMNALCSQVVDGALINIKQVDIDEEVIKVYATVIPPKLKVLLKRLQAGETPRALILSATASSETLEMILLDLIRMGAIRGILSTSSMPATFEENDAQEEGRIQNTGPTGEDEAKRERISTMPVSLDDISEIEVQKPSNMPAPAFPVQAQHGSPRLWKILAAVCFIGFIAMLSIYLASDRKTVPREAASAVPAVISQPEQRTQAIPTAAPPAASEGVVKVPSKSPQPPFSKGEDSKGERNVTPAKAGVQNQTKSNGSADSRLRGNDNFETSETPSTGKDSKTTDESPATTGVLYIKQPSDAPGRIKISVDGRVRGRSPIKLKLSPGLHEIVYSYQGRRIFKKVTIQANQRKEIIAEVPK
ncbi:MAG: response regulator [Myxococcota bacterium]|nr:response regulator [Myxococcota bacterium]